MICPNCGKVYDANGHFCSKCGVELVSEDAPEAYKFIHKEELSETADKESINCGETKKEPVKPEEEFPDWVIGDTVEIKNIKVKSNPADKLKKGMKITACVIGSFVALIIVAVIAISIILNQRVKITPAAYVGVEFEGYSSIGNAQVTCDYDKFKDDYRRIRVNEKELKNYLMTYGGCSPSEAQRKILSAKSGDMSILFDMCTSGYLDRTEKLTNGEVIYYFFETPVEEIEKCFKVSIDRETMSIPVAALDEIEIYDPFDLVDISFIGCSPYLLLDIDKSRLVGEYENLIFHTYDTEKISNGDVITITPQLECSREEYLEKYNRLPDLSPKQFTVENNTVWVTNPNNIPARMFNEMQNRAAIEIKKTTQNWDAGNVISQCDYMGYYFMSSRDESVIVGYNRCYLIYKITVDITQYDVKKKKDVTDQCTYFYYVGFKDLKVDNDGNELFDNDLIVPVWLYTYESDIVTATFKNSTVCYNFSTNGADEFRMIFEDTVGFCYASYKYEDNITDYEYYDFEHSFYGPYGYNGYIYNQGGWYMY